jgi:hypothetical protein
MVNLHSLTGFYVQIFAYDEGDVSIIRKTGLTCPKNGFMQVCDAACFEVIDGGALFTPILYHFESHVLPVR